MPASHAERPAEPTNMAAEDSSGDPLARGECYRAVTFFRPQREGSGPRFRSTTARSEFERDYLAKLLKITGGNVTQAAKLAKRNRTEFYKLLQRHHLDPKLFKTL